MSRDMRMLPFVAALLLVASPAAGDYIIGGQKRSPCNDLPPESKRAEPTVPFVVTHHSFEEIQYHCAAKHGLTTHQPITACVTRYPNPDGVFEISMPDYLSAEDYACVLIYEKAHLPPNDWQDDAWEDSVANGAVYDGRVEGDVTR